MKPLSLFPMILLLILLSPSTATAQTIPSPSRWITFVSTNSQIDVGDRIQAYDADGALCGQTEVVTKHEYRLSCRLDDFSTQTDEGIVADDRVSFRVNGETIGPTFAVPATIANAQEFTWDLRGGDDAVQPSCVDGYEPNDQPSAASSLTGPEAHTFYSEKKGWDQDWATFDADATWTYQVKARSGQPLALLQPTLKLFDRNGNLLAENQLDRWGRGAEIWWWNAESNQTVSILVEEATGRAGCLHYELTLQPYSPAEMQVITGQ